MLNVIIGRKIGQSQRFLEDGTRIPVTLVEVPGNVVVQIKDEDKHGYKAVQLGIGKKKHPSKSILGHVKKAHLSYAPEFIKEVKVEEVDKLPELGSVINVEEVLKPGDVVKVTGITKGKGFAGGVKRHGFRGGPRTHGQSDRERAPGSIGQTTTPGRVYKGKRMAGHMGNVQKSILNLWIADIQKEDEKNILLLSGLVPGGKNSLLTIEKIGEKKHFLPLHEITKPIQAEKPVSDQKSFDSENVSKNEEIDNANIQENTGNLAEEKTIQVKEDEKNAENK